MDIRKKILSIVGVLALTMSMTAGFAYAQETLPVDTSSQYPVNIVVNCSGGNASTGAVTLNSDSTDPVAFETFDPSSPSTVATSATAFRVDLDLGTCPGSAWSVTASITDFKTDPSVTPVHTIVGTYFQLPFSGATNWMVNETTPASNVTGPTGVITFSGTSSPYAGSQSLATPSGAATGTMYLEFGAQIVGLGGTVAEGTYTAQFTVTFNPSNP